MKSNFFKNLIAYYINIGKLLKIRASNKKLREKNWKKNRKINKPKMKNLFIIWRVLVIISLLFCIASRFSSHQRRSSYDAYRSDSPCIYLISELPI